MSDIKERLRNMAGEKANDLQAPERRLLLDAAAEVETALTAVYIEERLKCEALAEVERLKAEVEWMGARLRRWQQVWRGSVPMEGAHLRPDGEPCDYLGGDTCNKCGWVKRTEAREPEGEIERLTAEPPQTGARISCPMCGGGVNVSITEGVEFEGKQYVAISAEPQGDER